MAVRDIVFIALFAGIVAVLGIFPPVTLPLITVPITAQTLGVMLAGGVLGAKRGSFAIALFLLLVAIGLPLLSGGRGGFAVFLGASGGFLLGWVVSAFVVGWLIERFWSRLHVIPAFVACVLGGIVVLYCIGIPWVAVVAGISISQAFVASLAFIPGDVIKAVIAALVIVAVAKSYPIIRSNK